MHSSVRKQYFCVVFQVFYGESASVRIQREVLRDFEKLRCPENDLSFKKKDYWQKQPHQLQQKCDTITRKLVYAEQHNKYLKDELQQAKQLINQKDETIQSLQLQISGLKRRLDGERMLGENQDQLDWGDEQPETLEISLPQGHLSDSQDLLSAEMSLKGKSGQLREVLEEREEQLSVANEERCLTLELPSMTDVPQRRSKKKSTRLEEKLNHKLAEQEEKEFIRREESVMMEPYEPDSQAIKQLVELFDKWEERTQQRTLRQKQLQEKENVQTLQEVHHPHV